MSIPDGIRTLTDRELADILADEYNIGGTPPASGPDRLHLDEFAARYIDHAVRLGRKRHWFWPRGATGYEYATDAIEVLLTQDGPGRDPNPPPLRQTIPAAAKAHLRNLTGR